MTLTQEEIEFLRSQGRSENDVFETFGRAPLRVKDEAKRLGKSVLLHNPCAKGGHRLMTRYGHCIQCNPAVIAHAGRHEISGEVYVSVSEASGLCKVGMAVDSSAREKLVNHYSYAGANDWRVVFHIYARGAGVLESEAQRRLRRYQRQISYDKDGREQIAKEAYECKAIVAVNAVVEAASASDCGPSKFWKDPNFRW